MTEYQSTLKEQIPIIFLTGPPGAGKSSLGKQACQALNLSFLDLSLPEISELDFNAQKTILTQAIQKRSAHVIALSWLLQGNKAIRKLVRLSGYVLLLWAHPLDMQARSGYTEPLFTPSPRLKTFGGFGRTGSGCREFRSLNGFADEVLTLIDTSFDTAVDDLQYCIAGIRDESSDPPMVKSGISGWVDAWMEEYPIDKKTVTIIVNAMALYLMHLRQKGQSPRTLSGVYSDLEAAGYLVISYDFPKGKKEAEILDLFSYPPWTIEFKRKFSNSAKDLDRYERNLEDFARFLKKLKKKKNN